MFYFSRDNQTKKDLVNLLYLKINKALNKLCYLRLNLIYEYLHVNHAIFEHVFHELQRLIFRLEKMLYHRPFL